jgi:type I restriction enzyme M protein
MNLPPGKICVGATGADDPEGMTGDELLSFVNDTLFPTHKNMTLRHNKDAAKMVRDVFEDSYNYIKSSTRIKSVIVHGYL